MGYKFGILIIPDVYKDSSTPEYPIPHVQLIGSLTEPLGLYAFTT